MRALSKAELTALIDELKEAEGSYVEKFYEIDSDRFRIRLSRRGWDENLQILLPVAINATSYAEAREKPTGFAMAVRKRIEGYKIEEITQYGGDRIVIIKLCKGDSRLNLVIEMFGKGNFVITEQDMRITLAYKVHDFKDRSVKPGETYLPPKNEMKAGENVGAAQKPDPTIYRNDEGTALDYGVYPDEKHAGMRAQKFGRIQEALDEFYHELREREPEAGSAEKKKAEMEVRISIERQEGSIKGMEKEISESKMAGGLIFANMEQVNRIVSYAREHKRATMGELQSAFPGVRILNVNLQDKTVTIELG